MVYKTVEDEEVLAALKSKLSAADMKKKLIDIKQQQFREINQELKQIEKGSVCFAQFLKRNSITPYNDAKEAYMNHLIQEEKDKIACG